MRATYIISASLAIVWLGAGAASAATASILPMADHYYDEGVYRPAITLDNRPEAYRGRSLLPTVPASSAALQESSIAKAGFYYDEGVYRPARID